MTDDYTINYHFITYIFLFEKVGRMYFFNLGVKGLRRSKSSDAPVISFGFLQWTVHQRTYQETRKARPLLWGAKGNDHGRMARQQVPVGRGVIRSVDGPDLEKRQKRNKK